MIAIETASQPLKWFEWYKAEKPFVGNIGHLYPRFEDAIKRMIPIETRREIFNNEKLDYINWIERSGNIFQWEKDELKKSCIENNNSTVNNRTKDKIVKAFFKHLVENKLEAKDYLQIIP